MKKKIVYVLVCMCCCSLLTSAKQVGQYCDQSVYKETKKESCVKRSIKPASGIGVDLSPLNFFLSI